MSTSFFPTPSQVIKRDGRVVPFDLSRIERAIKGSLRDVGRPDFPAGIVTATVNLALGSAYGNQAPTVEQIQDLVERELMIHGEHEAAKAYILYRADHARKRANHPIPQHVRDAFEMASRYFPTPLQEFQFFDKYSRFDWSRGRRETWVETVSRAVDHLHFLAGDRISKEVYERIYMNMLEMRAMSSMRLLATAGPAAMRNDIAIYNCSFMGVNSIDAFVEALIISMSGTGVGYSVEKKYVHQLPFVLPQRENETPIQYIIRDDSEGWAEALRFGLESWFAGKDVAFDYSLIRPAGAVLKTKGGRSSGPGVLKAMLEAIRRIVLSRQGEKLTSLNAHDCMCFIAAGAVQGAHRRSAMISLFDADDEEMRLCKTYENMQGNDQRWAANNSMVVTDETLDETRFKTQFIEMAKSGTGEPGIFNRSAAIRMRGSNRTLSENIGTNPCGEIVLEDMEFCNLSIAVARPDDTFETLAEKVRVAAIIGTIQSLATDFKGLRPQWKANCERERLLGVDITGQMDCPLIQDAEVMQKLREIAIETNKEFAALLHIAQSASVTCVKPSGNSSVLLNTSSGLHARHAPYYIRRVRVGAHTPIFQVMRDEGVELKPENGQTAENASVWVASFPVKAPEGTMTGDQRTALEQLEYWLLNKLNWTTHNPSCTISYTPDEIPEMTDWVWDHISVIGGLSFLPKIVDDKIYPQAPLEAISEETYLDLEAKFPHVNYSKLWNYEWSDVTTASSTASCEGPLCIVETVPTA